MTRRIREETEEGPFQKDPPFGSMKNRSRETLMIPYLAVRRSQFFGIVSGSKALKMKHIEPPINENKNDGDHLNLGRPSTTVNVSSKG